MIKSSIRPYLETDSTLLIQLLEGGMGPMLGFSGHWSQHRWKNFLSELASYQTVFFEKNLKAVEAGFAGLKDYNAINGSANLIFFCLGPDNKNTLPSASALVPVLEWAFQRLRLNKLTIEVVDGNDILNHLEELGFVAEGVRQKAFQINSDLKDVTVCSILFQTWRDQ